MYKKLTLVLLGALFFSLPINTVSASSYYEIKNFSSQVPLSGKVPGCIYKGKQLSGKVFVVKYAYQADIKVYQTNSKFQSDLVVSPTKYSYQATKCGLWNFVDYSYQSDFKVYFVKYSYQSDFSVFFTKYSYQAGTN